MHQKERIVKIEVKTCDPISIIYINEKCRDCMWIFKLQQDTDVDIITINENHEHLKSLMVKPICTPLVSNRFLG